MTGILDVSFGRSMAVVLGTNEIASAVAVHLHRAGRAVVLSHDPTVPVLRRGMAFDDVVWGDPAVVDGLPGVAAERVTDVFAALGRRDGVVVTRLGLVDLMVLGRLDLLVDARMLKYATIPDLRHLARATIGLGPGFVAGRNCDRAVETRPGRLGVVLVDGATDDADGVSSPLGGVGGERFLRADLPGRWRTALTIGRRVFRGMVLGHLDGTALRAPMDGLLRGLVRDGVDVPARVKLVEIDPRNRWQARWTGIDERGRAIAETTALAAWTLARAEAGDEPPLAPALPFVPRRSS